MDEDAVSTRRNMRISRENRLMIGGGGVAAVELARDGISDCTEGAAGAALRSHTNPVATLSRKECIFARSQTQAERS
jgi:hypothetical protein